MVQAAAEAVGPEEELGIVVGVGPVGQEPVLRLVPAEPVLAVEVPVAEEPAELVPVLVPEEALEVVEPVELVVELAVELVAVPLVGAVAELEEAPVGGLEAVEQVLRLEPGLELVQEPVDSGFQQDA